MLIIDIQRESISTQASSVTLKRTAEMISTHVALTLNPILESGNRSSSGRSNKRQKMSNDGPTMEPEEIYLLFACSKYFIVSRRVDELRRVCVKYGLKIENQGRRRIPVQTDYIQTILNFVCDITKLWLMA